MSPYEPLIDLDDLFDPLEDEMETDIDDMPLDDAEDDLPPLEDAGPVGLESAEPVGTNAAPGLLTMLNFYRPNWDRATWNRIRIVPFESVFTQHAPNDNPFIN